MSDKGWESDRALRERDAQNDPEWLRRLERRARAAVGVVLKFLVVIAATCSTGVVAGATLGFPAGFWIGSLVALLTMAAVARICIV
jgi:hypothetical protein